MDVDIENIPCPAPWWPTTGTRYRRCRAPTVCGGSYWVPDDSTVYMRYAYSKNEQGDLTPTQVRARSARA